jgi:hypothetical protein
MAKCWTRGGSGGVQQRQHVRRDEVQHAAETTTLFRMCMCAFAQ